MQNGKQAIPGWRKKARMLWKEGGSEEPSKGLQESLQSRTRKNPAGLTEEGGKIPELNPRMLGKSPSV